MEKSENQEKLEKSFLVLKLKEENGKIIYENEISYIKKELIEILKEGIKSSENIPRPENFFYRSDKNILKIIDMDEEFVQNSIGELQKILEGNFSELERASIVFDKFKHLFSEIKRLKEVLKKENINKKKLQICFSDYKNLER